MREFRGEFYGEFRGEFQHAYTLIHKTVLVNIFVRAADDGEFAPALGL